MHPWFLLLAMHAAQAEAPPPPGPPTAIEAPRGEASPQALASHLQAAAQREDFAEVYRCMEPAARRRAIGELVQGAFLQVGIAAKAGRLSQRQADALLARLDGALARHQVPELGSLGRVDDPELQRALDAVDLPSLFLELISIQRDLPGAEPTRHAEGRRFAHPLTQLQVDGDRATALLGEEPIGFVRRDGRWFIATPQP